MKNKLNKKDKIGIINHQEEIIEIIEIIEMIVEFKPEQEVEDLQIEEIDK